MITTFQKLMFPGQTGTYDPDTEGFFALAFLPGADGKHTGPNGECMELCLAQGCVGTPGGDRERVERDFALTVAEYPFTAGKLGVFKVPCAFSDRASWVELSREPRAELVELARLVPSSRSGCWRQRDWWGSGEAWYLETLRKEVARETANA